LVAAIHTLGGTVLIEFSAVVASSDSECSLEDIVASASLLSPGDAVKLAQTIGRQTQTIPAA
jgi:hypothetical protein